MRELRIRRSFATEEKPRENRLGHGSPTPIRRKTNAGDDADQGPGMLCKAGLWRLASAQTKSTRDLQGFGLASWPLGRDRLFIDL